jgi:hypothetical protein
MIGLFVSSGGPGLAIQVTGDLNRCIALGGNIYFLAEIGATDGKSFQQMAGSMTGMTETALFNREFGIGPRRLGNQGCVAQDDIESQAAIRPAPPRQPRRPARNDRGSAR